jgi:phosphopantetheine--protein transferase-like protein
LCYVAKVTIRGNIKRIFGRGIDIEEIGHGRRLLEMPGSKWLAATFSSGERRIADPPPRDADYHAGRFAAKEAIGKAIARDDRHPATAIRGH